jgi:hypothetical protein
MDQKIIRAKAGENLTSHQFKLVYVDGSDTENVKLVATNGGTVGSHILGVLQNTPGDDEAALVCVEGLCTAKAGAALEPFDLLTVNASGLLRKASQAGDYIVGCYVPESVANARRDAASGDEIRVLLFGDKTRRLDLGTSSVIDLDQALTDTNTTSTITVTGAEVGDFAVVNPRAALAAGLSIYGYVSAADTVTVVVVNATANTVNPASNTFDCIVFKKNGRVIS